MLELRVFEVRVSTLDMGTTKQAVREGDVGEDVPIDWRSLRVQAAVICQHGNGHAAVNDLVLEAKKERIRYRNGKTLPASAKRLLADAQRNARHSMTLSRNLFAAGEQRPVNVAAHHIVARRDQAADLSRKLIFGWGIAINDVDNGVFLPRWKRSVVPSLPKAIKHSVVHTERYHLEVLFRLDAVARLDPKNRQAGRQALKTIKSELVDGTFPYLPESNS